MDARLELLRTGERDLARQLAQAGTTGVWVDRVRAKDFSRSAPDAVLLAAFAAGERHETKASAELLERIRASVPKEFDSPVLKLEADLQERQGHKERAVQMYQKLYGSATTEGERLYALDQAVRIGGMRAGAR